MKPFKSFMVVVAAVATVFLTATATSNAGRAAAQGGGRLVVWRSPGLGNDLIVGLTIDGRRAMDITYGAHYDAMIPAGRHVIGVKAFPQPHPQPSFTVEINVKPGQLYNFTAKGGTSQLVLK